MTEYPNARPDTDLTWAESGTSTEPLVGKKATGWTLNEAPPYDLFNWFQREYNRHIDHLEAITQRQYDNLRQAIQETSPFDRFYLRHAPQAWTDASQDKATKHGTSFAVSKIACDGLRLYYIQNGELIATPCEPGGVDTAWAVNLAANGITTTVNDLDTDGSIVALGAASGGTNTLLVVNCANGSVVNASAPVSPIVRVQCHSDATERRVYLITGASTAVTKWDDTPASSTLITAAGTVNDIAATPYGLFVGHGSPSGVITAYDRSGTQLGAIDVHTGAGTIQPTAIAHDGRRGYYRARAINGSGPDTSDQQSAYWTTTIGGTAGGALRIMSVDSKFLFGVEVGADGIYALDKHTGAICYQWDTTGGTQAGALASDGRYLWTNIRVGVSGANYLTALPIQRNPGFWIRADAPDGSSGSFIARPMPFMRLAIPE